MDAGDVSSKKAISSMVLGIMSIICLCNLFTGIPAIIFGLIALSDISSNPGTLTGRGMAITGIVLGAFGSSIWALVTIGFLVGLTLPAMQVARHAARRAQSMNNLKQLGLALNTIADQNATFPAQFTLDAAGKPGSSWRVQLLPNMDAAAAFQLYHLDEPWNSPGNLHATATIPPQFVNPLDPDGPDVAEAGGEAGTATVGYVAVAGPGFVFDGDKPCTLRSISDGLSNTIMVIDVTQSGIALAEPRDLTWDEFLTRYQSRNLSGDRQGFIALFADGSVQRIPYDLDPQTLRAYFTIDGGEKVAPPALNDP